MIPFSCPFVRIILIRAFCLLEEYDMYVPEFEPTKKQSPGGFVVKASAVDGNHFQLQIGDTSVGRGVG